VSLFYRLVNRSASTLRELEQLHPALVEHLPMRFAGTTGDEFLTRYLDASRNVEPPLRTTGSEP
jgi:hypothetical protein